MSQRTKFGSKPSHVPSGAKPLRKRITPQDPTWPFPPLSGPVKPKRKRKLDDIEEALL